MVTRSRSVFGGVVKRKTKGEIAAERRKKEREKEEREAELPTQGKESQVIRKGLIRGEEGQSFLGASREEAEEAFQKQLQAGKPQAIQRQTRSAAKRVGETQQFLAQRGVSPQDLTEIEEVTELDIERQGVEDLPIVGPIAKAFGGEGTTSGDFIRNRLLNIARPFLGDNLSDEELSTQLEPLLSDPQTQRELALQEIQRKEIEKGLSLSEEVGKFIDSIPLGPRAREWVGSLIETPSGNAQKTVDLINEMASNAESIADKVKTNESDPTSAFALIEDYENKIYQMEQRFKILSINSPTLIADADRINEIEEEIRDAKNKMRRAKNAVIIGKVQEPNEAKIALDLIRG